MEFDELSNRVIGCAIEVHRTLGPGLLESNYEQCLAHELKLNGMAFKLQWPLPVQYKGIRLDCGYRVDILGSIPTRSPSSTSVRGPARWPRSVLAASPECRDAVRTWRSRRPPPNGHAIPRASTPSPICPRACSTGSSSPTNCSTTCRSVSPCSTTAGARRTSTSEPMAASSSACRLRSTRCRRVCRRRARSAHGPR